MHITANKKDHESGLFCLIFLFSKIQNSKNCGAENDIRDKLEKEVSSGKSEEHILYRWAKAFGKSPSLNCFKEEKSATYKEDARINYGTYYRRS